MDWVLLLVLSCNPRGYSPLKVTRVLFVPFRGLNFWIGSAKGALKQTPVLFYYCTRRVK